MTVHLCRFARLEHVTGQAQAAGQHEGEFGFCRLLRGICTAAAA